MKKSKNTFLFLFLPCMLFSNELYLNSNLTNSSINKDVPAYQRDKVLLKIGSGSTIVLHESSGANSNLIDYLPSKKTRIRPTIGISYRTPFPKNKIINTLDVSFSYSYNDIERKKRNYSIGEIFFPKISALHFFSFEKDKSYYFGSGIGAFSSWQKETHTQSPSLLSSKDDTIYNIRSFSFIGAAGCVIIGYEMNRHREISSGIQIEINSPLFPLTTNNNGKRSPLSLELSYIAGF